MTRLRFRLISPALISTVLFPPLGISGLIYLIAGFVFQHYGKTKEAERTFIITNRMIEISVYIFLVIMVVSSFIIYWKGGELISALGSFY